MNQDLLTQHKEIYYGSLKELILNNTKAFIEDDLLPLFMKPPLETMDMIKQRLLSFAKENALILNMEHLDQYLSSFRKEMQEEVRTLGKKREEALLAELEKTKKSEEEMFKLLKKDFLKLNQQLKKEYKQTLTKAIEENFSKNISSFFTESDLKEKVITEITKFFKKTYPNQIIESYSMKILVKDTILMNSMKEQTERFLFTKENSHLFD